MDELECYHAVTSYLSFALHSKSTDLLGSFFVLIQYDSLCHEELPFSPHVQRRYVHFIRRTHRMTLIRHRAQIYRFWTRQLVFQRMGIVTPQWSQIQRALITAAQFEQAMIPARSSLNRRCRAPDIAKNAPWFPAVPRRRDMIWKMHALVIWAIQLR
jgi:hypothetical protein